MGSEAVNQARIRGTTGELRWSYQLAATLGPWTLEDHVLTASVLKTDENRVSQTPMFFSVPRPVGRPWIWPIRELHLAGDSLTATLGPQERDLYAARATTGEQAPSARGR